MEAAEFGPVAFEDGWKENVSYWCLSYPVSPMMNRTAKSPEKTCRPVQVRPLTRLDLQECACVGACVCVCVCVNLPL